MSLIHEPSTPIKDYRENHIFHITCNYSPTLTGITKVISQLTHYLVRQGKQTTILAAGLALSPVTNGVEIIEFPISIWVERWRYPCGLRNYLERVSRIPGAILHLHAPWMAPQWVGSRKAKRYRIPALLTLHGLLEPYYWRYDKLRCLRYSCYWWTMAYPAFRHLPLIHAITPLERDHLATLFPGQRLEIIPNAIDLKEVDNSLATIGLESVSGEDTPYLLFLGLLHPKKGVNLLIEAFARAGRGRNFRLLIVGPDYFPAYAAQLRARVRALGLERQISFLGPVVGTQKWHLYRDAWAFCAPSHSEAVGLVNLEAAAASTPVVTTHETGLFDWEEGGGILVHPQVEHLQVALEQVFSWSDSERQERGRKLRQLVERRYSWQAVGPLWLELYSKILAL